MVTAQPWRKALAANSTSTSFTAQIPVATEPSGTGVFNLTALDPGVGSATHVPSHIILHPYGTDGNDDTFDMRLWGYNKVAASDLWVPILLLDLSVILGNISGAAVGTGVFMADSLTVNDGGADNGPWSHLVNSAEELGASIITHLKGCQYIKFDWDLAGAQEAVAMNCFWRTMDKC